MKESENLKKLKNVLDIVFQMYEDDAEGNSLTTVDEIKDAIIYYFDNIDNI